MKFAGQGSLYSQPAPGLHHEHELQRLVGCTRAHFKQKRRSRSQYRNSIFWAHSPEWPGPDRWCKNKENSFFMNFSCGRAGQQFDWDFICLKKFFL